VSDARSILAAAVLLCGAVQAQPASWLDQATPASWNEPGEAIPTAPRAEGNDDPRCRAQARPPQLRADRLLRERGWDLVGAYQGGWNALVIAGTAAYDGMCRPLQYQYFVFVHGRFAGTLSPRPMDSRTDGALGRVWLQSGTRLIAEYLRYAPNDALCCASRTTRVDFDLSAAEALVRPLSAATSENR